MWWRSCQPPQHYGEPYSALYPSVKLRSFYSTSWGYSGSSVNKAHHLVARFVEQKRITIGQPGKFITRILHTFCSFQLASLALIMCEKKTWAAHRTPSTSFLSLLLRSCLLSSVIFRFFAPVPAKMRFLLFHWNKFEGPYSLPYHILQPQTLSSFTCQTSNSFSQPTCLLAPIPNAPWFSSEIFALLVTYLLCSFRSKPLRRVICVTCGES